MHACIRIGILLFHKLSVIHSSDIKYLLLVTLLTATVSFHQYQFENIFQQLISYLTKHFYQPNRYISTSNRHFMQINEILLFAIYHSDLIIYTKILCIYVIIGMPLFIEHCLACFFMP